MSFLLYGAKGSGSAIAEAVLARCGLAYRSVEAPPWTDGDHLAALTAANPLRQVPTLVLPDGSVMTESAAMALYFAEAHPEAGLMPPAGDGDRARFLRWLVFIVANIYPTFTMGDDPSRWQEDAAAQAALRKSTDAYRERLWRLVEAEITLPWFLGQRFSALDIYLAAMAHWRPRRPWFEENCPRIAGIAAAVSALPELREIWARHFSA
jgi:GST-like protein